MLQVDNQQKRRRGWGGVAKPLCKTKPSFTFTLTFPFVKTKQPGKNYNYTDNLPGARLFWNALVLRQFPVVCRPFNSTPTIFQLYITIVSWFCGLLIHFIRFRGMDLVTSNKRCTSGFFLLQFMQRSALRIEKEKHVEEQQRVIDDEHWVLDLPQTKQKE